MFRTACRAPVSLRRAALVPVVRSLHTPARASPPSLRPPRRIIAASFTPSVRPTVKTPTFHTAPARTFSTNANMEARNKAAVEEVDRLIKENTVIIFGRTACPYCVKAKRLFDGLKVPYKYLEVDNLDDGEYIHDVLIKKTSRRTFPNIFVNGTNTGGCDDTVALHGKGQLVPMLKAAGLNPAL